MSTVDVGDLGSYVYVQLGYRSLTRSGSACFAFWLAGSGGVRNLSWAAEVGHAADQPEQSSDHSIEVPAAAPTHPDSDAKFKLIASLRQANCENGQKEDAGSFSFSFSHCPRSFQVDRAVTDVTAHVQVTAVCRIIIRD